MRTILAGVFLAAAFGLAGADDKPTTDKQGKKDVDAVKQFEQIKQDYINGRKTMMEGVKNAKDGAEKKKLQDENKAKNKELGEKAVELIVSHPNDVPLEAFNMAVGLGGPDAGKKLLAIVKDNYADKSDKLIPLMTSSVSQVPGAEEMFAAIGESSKDKTIRGMIQWTLLSAKIENADYPRGGTPLPAAEQAKVMAELTEKLNALVKEHGDLKIPGRKGSKPLSEVAKDKLYFLENLVVGKTLPDVECDPLKGDKKVKLSDLRGKVVVLDIWATWCGPCRAMIPHEREMVKHFKDKPFQLVSLSADDDKETLEKFLKEEGNEMPWTHWWSKPSGDIIKAYQVQFYPTIYVLDAKGVIRFKHVRGEAMDKAVETLLEEMEKGGKKSGE